MKADMLHVVTCIYNPVRWESRIRHYKAFAEHMLDSGVKLTVVECAMGRRPHILDDNPHINHIAVRANTMAWNKEGLLNLAFHRIPETDEYLAWVDADIEFRSKTWAADAVHALQQYPVIQPWSEALDLGPQGEPMRVKGFHVQTSFAKVWRECGDIKPRQGDSLDAYAYPHPGYAWCIRRNILNDIGGLIEVSGLGAGDHQMAMAFIGRIQNSIHGQTSQAYQAAIRAWGERAYKFVQGKVGYINGTVEHQFHGTKERRLYHERWATLIKHDYNPVTDIKKNMYGVIELAGNKPEMEQDFDRYFRQRFEDSNCLDP